MAVIKLPKQFQNELQWNKYMVFGIAVWTVIVYLAEADSQIVKNKCFNDKDNNIDDEQGGQPRYTFELFCDLSFLFLFSFSSSLFLLFLFSFSSLSCLILSYLGFLS